MRGKPEQSMYRLVTLFVSRQSLVFQAIKKLRPQILVSTQALDKQQIELPRGSRFDTPQTGYWGADEEWRYYLHGLGCRIVNTTTQEPIEWNAPELQSFDKYWFINWLR